MDRMRKSSAGGHLALDFTNTLSWDPNDLTAGEKLHSFQALLDWTAEAGVLAPEKARALRGRASAQPNEAAAVHRRAIVLRSAMHEIFASFATGSRRPAGEWVSDLNGELAHLPLRLRISSSGATWDWSWSTEELECVLWPLVWSAASLLTSADLERVKLCAGDRCGWLFVDNSRRRNRRWCDMRDCGNRAKARRHYYRHRG